MRIDANGMHFQQLNQMIRETEDRDLEIVNCQGQRYNGSGLGKKHIRIRGVPGNALGAYLDGAELEVFGNAQDATGDTMNAGSIVIHGSSGDATGYAMRGGRILVEGDAGYRAGIHMKAYRDKLPVLVIGGRAGSFLGEYQAGGLIAVLGAGGGAEPCVGRFCATGMHGGRILLRGEEPPRDLSPQVLCRPAGPEALAHLLPHLQAFCQAFGGDHASLLSGPFQVLEPDTHNPYQQLYTLNEVPAPGR